MNIYLNNDLNVKRHSLGHVMVLAYKRLFEKHIPLGVGPVIDDGFYQDFDAELSGDMLEKLESEMQSIISENLEFEYSELSIDKAIKHFKSLGQLYKVELLEDIRDKGSSKVEGSEEDESVKKLRRENLVSFYEIGDHLDLCRGPHVSSSGELKGVAFKLHRIAGAYWRGSEKNKMLNRIYGLVFASEKELKRELHLREEAIKRDHRKLGPALDLFFFHESAPGMPYWLPKGQMIKNLLLRYWREYHEGRGYQEISAPLLNKRELWEVSGHWEHYKDDMISASIGDDSELALKPMNCANAMLVWKRKPRSYRELPLRLSDCDLLHRAERSGSLSGLLRARCFCQDDSHNFVAEDQIGDEIKRILGIVKDFYQVFGLYENVKLYLSLRPDDFMGDPQVWDRAEESLKRVLEESGHPFWIKEKDGAFYGPKIDIHLSDALGREWQCGTVQLDFQLPKNFELEYVDSDGQRKRPVVIHRVIYGSFERFIGILIEHFNGAFPFWIAPLQLKVISLLDDESYLEQSERVLESVYLSKPLAHNKLRYEVDRRDESLSKKIREAWQEKVPIVLIAGEREAREGKVAVRLSSGERHELALDELSDFLMNFQAPMKSD